MLPLRLFCCPGFFQRPGKFSRRGAERFAEHGGERVVSGLPKRRGCRFFDAVGAERFAVQGKVGHASGLSAVGRDLPAAKERKETQGRCGWVLGKMIMGRMIGADWGMVTKERKETQRRCGVGFGQNDYGNKPDSDKGKMPNGFCPNGSTSRAGGGLGNLDHGLVRFGAGLPNMNG